MLVLLFHSTDRRRTTWAACLWIAAAVASAGQAFAADVTVSVADGRKFTAEVDSRSDEQRLWLRFGTGKTMILRPIEWSAVVGVRLNGVESNVAELRRMVSTTSTDTRDAPRALQTVAPRGGLRLWKVPGSESADASADVAPVRSLYLDVYAANWDADVENDGIVLTFASLDANGQATDAAGTLEVELIGERLPPYSRGNAFPVLGRWTRAISRETGDANGYQRLRLPYQAVQPDYEINFPTYALAHVRFIVPGQGVFEASVDAVALRGFTPVRDRMQSASGARFAPTERTSGARRVSSLSE